MKPAQPERLFGEGILEGWISRDQQVGLMYCPMAVGITAAKLEQVQEMYRHAYERAVQSNRFKRWGRIQYMSLN